MSVHELVIKHMRYCGEVEVTIQPTPDREYRCYLRAGDFTAEVIAYAPRHMPNSDLIKPDTLDEVAGMAVMTVGIHAAMYDEEPLRIVCDDDGDPLIARNESEAWGPD